MRHATDGMWGPSITLDSYKLYLADPKGGQVGFFHTLEKQGHPAILGLRLKIIIRSTARGGFSDPKALKDQPLLNEAWTKSAGWCTQWFASITPEGTFLTACPRAGASTSRIECLGKRLSHRRRHRPDGTRLSTDG
jgi:hypothetical protein